MSESICLNDKIFTSHESIIIPDYKLPVNAVTSSSLSTAIQDYKLFSTVKGHSYDHCTLGGNVLMCVLKLMGTITYHSPSQNISSYALHMMLYKTLCMNLPDQCDGRSTKYLFDTKQLDISAKMNAHHVYIVSSKCLDLALSIQLTCRSYQNNQNKGE